MKKKMLSIMLSVVMVVTLIPTVAFAGESADSEHTNTAILLKNAVPDSDQLMDVENQAAVVEGVVGTEDIHDNIKEGKDSYVATNEYDSIRIPKDGSQAVLSISEGGDANNEKAEIVGMNLPDIVQESDAKMSDTGTVVYNTDKDAFVAVQAIEENILGEEFQAMRAMVAITDATAPKEYEFKFDLPEGYYLVSDYDIDNEYDQYDCGAVFIANSEGQLSSTIEPAWAVDSNGKPVNTKYIIKGNTLIQKVEFDENSVFPIVADPKHVSKTKTFTKTVQNTKTDRNWVIAKRREIDKRQNNTISTVRDLLCSIIGIKVTTLGIAATALSVCTSSNSSFLERCEDKYTEIYEKLTSNRKIKSITITEKYKGVYVKHAKHYAWTAQIPTYKSNY